LEAGPGTGDLDLSLNFLAASARLQVAQLEAVVAELLSAQKSNTTAAGEIQKLLAQPGCTGLSAGEIGKTAAAMTEVVESLHAALGQEPETVAQMVRHAKQVRAATSTLGSVSDGVKHSVESIAIDLRLIALNAQVQAAQVGRGTGLGPLAEFTREIADVAGQFDKKIRTGVEAQTASVQRITEKSATLHEAADSHRQELEARIASCDADLQASGELVRSASGTVCESLGRVKEQADTLRDLADFGAISRASLDELVVALNEISSALTNTVAPADILHPRFQAFEKNYTMGSERSIHAAVLGQSMDAGSSEKSNLAADSIGEPGADGEPKTKDTDESAEAMAGKGFGENVELFSSNIRRTNAG
jgi:hypothetical protein